MKKLSNKKSLVTGASRGIGKAIALQLAREGCTVGVHYRDREDEAKAVVAEIEKQGGKAYLFQADLANTEDIIAMGTNAWETMSGIDFLINNAGISYKKHFLDYSIDDINQFTDINFKGTLFLTQTIARLMVASNTEGSIYTITSVNGIRPGLGLSAYGATKGALETLMKGVALEMAPHHIKVNTLALGAVETDMTAGVINDPVHLKEVNEGIPMGRFGHADEIAHVLVDLVSSGSYITGSSITIDGGLLLMRGYEKNKKYKF